MLFEHCDDICEDKNNRDNKSRYSPYLLEYEDPGHRVRRHGCIVICLSTDKKGGKSN